MEPHAWLDLSDRPVILTIAVVIALQTLIVARLVYKQLFQHPLSRFPGPKLAAITTYRKAWIELVRQKSWHEELVDLHKEYGSIVRVGPNELHFRQPEAYPDIYNNVNRWNKEERLYRSFDADRSTFGFLTYKEAKQRKDVLNRSFSASAVQGMAPLVQEKVDSLCEAFTKLSKTNTAADLSWAFRCMTVDVIAYISFGKSMNAIHAPGFAAPILVAMDAAFPVGVAFKHFEFFKNMIMHMPPELSKKLSPQTAGLVDLHVLVSQQIEELVADPSKVEYLPHNNTIYHSLLNPKAHKDGKVPETGSLFEESQSLLFAGADTVGNTLMVAIFHFLKTPHALSKIKDELRAIWPDVEAAPPSSRELEKLPYFEACLKEALRLACGVVSGLLRVTPAGGATIVGQHIPENTIVSIGSTFVHYNEDIFPDPFVFKPERWIEDPTLDNWLVAFSRGPRACLGINLAWLELRLALAGTIRRFDFELDPSSPDELVFRDCFLPEFRGPHVKAHLTPVTA